MDIITVVTQQTVQLSITDPEFSAVLVTVCIPTADVEDCDSNEAKRDAIAEAIGDAARAAIAG